MNDEWRQWKFAGIYGIRHRESGKIYVGQSQNITKRIYQHKLSFVSEIGSPYLYRAILKHGWDAFEIIMLEQVSDLILLTKREQHWLDTLDACNPDKGYNICPIAKSCRGVKRTDESKMKDRIAHLGKKQSLETVEKRKASMLKIRALPEYYAQISNALKGRKFTEETIAKKHATMERLYHTDERTTIVLGHIENNHLINLTEAVRGSDMSAKTAIRIANRAGWYKKNGCWIPTKNNSIIINECADSRIDVVLSYVINNPAINYSEIARNTNISRRMIAQLIKQAGWIKENRHWKCINGDMNATSHENSNNTDSRESTLTTTDSTACTTDATTV